MAVLAHGFVHACPTSTLADFGTHVWGEGVKKYEQLSNQFYRHFRRFSTLFFLFRKNPLKIDPPGGRGGPPNFVSPQNFFFWCVKTTCKFLDPYNNLFWEKSNIRRERKKRR
jgi:hypothetical protein